MKLETVPYKGSGDAKGRPFRKAYRYGPELRRDME
jgi:hypothetical protein